MKQKKIVGAYKAMESLYRQHMPLREARKIFNLRMALQPAINFQSEEEKKMLEEMGLALEFGGYVNFKSEDQQKAYFQRVEEIGETEADLEIDPVALPKLDGIQISAEELEALEGFVEFTEE